MKRITSICALVGLLTVPALGQTPTDPRETLDWMRALVMEGRVGLQLQTNSVVPSLFAETTEDGRSWMDYIADTLGAAAGGNPSQPGVANQWAMLDEAVSVLLAEADKMKEFAAARAGTADEAKFQNARRSYLAGAAKLLNYYKVAAGDVFDSNAGALPSGVPDWLLPGEIKIKEVAGAARLNTQSGEFSGRFSGQLELPGFGATLAIADASFASDGSFDLSAYGNLNFNGGQLSIPPRKPAHVSFRPERGVFFEGDARLSLSNGLRFDASMSLRDPQYCFSLAARGMEFDLGKQLMLRRIVIQDQALENLGKEGLYALGEYYHSLNGAAETLLTAATNFPPIHETQFGQPPEFSAPEITFDFSSLNAWSAEIIANTRAGLTNAQQGLQNVLDAVQRLNEQARDATNALADERGRLMNLAARLELRRQMNRASDLAAAQQLTNAAGTDELNNKLIAGLHQEGALVVKLITPDLLDRFNESLEVARLLVDVEAGLQDRDADSTPGTGLPVDPCAACTNNAASFVQRAEALTLCAARRQVARYGLNPINGSVTNTSTFNGLGEFELYRTGRLLSSMEADLQAQGLVTSEFTSLIEPLLNRQRELLLAEMTNSNTSLVRSFEIVNLVMENIADSAQANLILPNEQIVAQMELAMSNRIVRLTNEVGVARTPAAIDAARAEAAKAIEPRQQQVRSDVEHITGRHRTNGVVRPGDHFQPDPLTQLIRFFIVMNRPVPPVIGNTMDAYVRFKVAELRAEPFTVEFLTNRVNDAHAFASMIIGLTDWADARLTNDFAFLNDLRFTITNYSIAFSGAAEAQRAWWLLDRYQQALRKHTEVYGERLNAGLRLAEQQSHARSLAASMRVSGAFSNLLANIVVRNDVIVPLPGKVEVTRIFGRLCFNRVTGFMQGCFGGRLEFPEVATNAFFEINNACLDTLGNYSIAASTEFPLSLGRSDLEATVNVTGTPAGVATFSGNGTLTVSNGVAGTQVLNVSLSYDQPQRRLSFDAVGNDLDMRITDDFVIFDAGFGFDLSLASPEGAFRASGSAGLLARQHPLPANVDRSNFHLVVDGLTTVFSYSANAFAISLSNGTLRLPDIFHNGLCTNAGSPTGPQVGLAPGSAITVNVGAGDNPSLNFTGGFDFRNLGFNVPGLTNLGIEVCSARLLFRENRLPCFTNLNATLSIPLPQQTVLMDVNNVVWCVDGFPDAANVSLRQPLRLFDVGGVAFEFQTNTTFGFTTSVAAPQAANAKAIGPDGRSTTFTVVGGLRGSFDASKLADAQTGSGFTFDTSGTFSWTTGELPQIGLGNVTFAGRMKLGGPTGFELLGVDTNGIPDPNGQSMASITLAGLTNLFALSSQRPFEVRISGAMGSADFVFFGLGDAKFRFDGQAPEPEFSVASLGFRAGEQLELLQQQALPFRITAGSIAFINPNLPLNQLFAAQNLRFTFSGEIDISLAPPDANSSDIPRLFGALQNVQVSLPNGFSGNPQFSINTFTLLLENLTIGDMAGLSGGLTVGNLNNPSELYFAGTVGGGYNGVGIKAIVAIRLDGLLGACLSVNAGPAGIPLDGGTLGGILLTGAEGGVSLLNQFSDPCDFKSFLQLSGDGTPAPAPPALTAAKNFSGPHVSQLQVVTWEELARFQKLHEQQKALRKAGLAKTIETTRPADTMRAKGAGADVPCPTGDCPPATLNLLCQRHPSVGEAPSAANYNGTYAERVIFKFSSLDRTTVDEILSAANINLNGSASVVAGNFANATRDFINSLIPRPPTSMPADQRLEINQFLDNSLAAMRNALASVAQAALQAAAGQGRTPLEALYEAGYGGVKCVDITIQLKGTFSYAPISIALSAEGGAVASTTGSAGVLGSVNLFGIPVGTGEFFYSLTDTNGSLNPSLCGGAHIALGPLEFGNLALAIGCDDCITGELNALAQFVNGLSGQVLADASPIIYAFIENAAGHRVSNIRGRALNTFFGPPNTGAVLTAEEQVAVLTALLNLPKVVMFLQQNPNAVSEFGNNAVRALGEQVIQLSLNLYNALNPRLQFCGEAEPKIFGFSLTGGNALVAARAYADKTNVRGDVTFSPSYVFGNLPFFLLSGGTINNIVPALDEATMGMSLGLPVVNNSTIRLLTTNPVQFATAQLNHLLDSSTVTFGYELSPFGFKLADGEGRVSLPTLANHPDNPARRSARPQDYNASGQFVPPSSPDRSAILKAALDSNVLAQATWAGKGSDLANLFPSGSQQAQGAAGRELVRDYFPHGGFLGAAKVQLPKPITDAPPLDQLAQIFAPPTNILQQITVAQQVFENYVLGSREVGHLMTYVPFPKPPPAFWNIPQSPQALIDSIAAVNVDTLVTQGLGLYPAEQFFMSGGVNAQFLGLPIGQGTLVADPAAGLFRLSAGTPAGSWMKSFFDVQMVFEIKRADYIAQSAPQGSTGTNATLSPDTRLQAALSQLLGAAQPGATAQQRQQALNNAVTRITDTLPKVSLDLALTNFGIPPALTNVLRANAAARIVAYSPRFEPGFVGVGPVADARRNGGVAFKGRFNFASYVEIDNAELGVGLRGAGLPVLSGVFDVPNLGVPGLALRNAHFEFNSDPVVNGAYIAARGAVDPITFRNPINQQPLLTVRNLTNATALISANFDLRRAASGPPLPGFAISPSRIDIPMLGPSLSIRMHGATTNDPFAFSSSGPWSAQVSVSGFISVRDPLNTANEIARIGATGSQFSALLEGTGMQFDLFAITLPNNISIITFPGTAFQQTFTLGSGGADNRLRISRDGSFILEGGIGGSMPLNGLNGFGSISGGASFRLSNSGLTVTINGNLSGGALNTLSNVNLASLSGQFSATRTAVSLSGVATMAPMQFGVFLVSGTSGGNITAVLTNTGFSIPTGAKLRLLAEGYPTNDLFTLNTFSISGNGDFNVSATSGALNIPGYFSTTNGSFALLRSGGVVSLDIVSPTLRLFPQKPYETPITAPFSHVFMDSTGRFYADTGNRAINLPAGFVARGRLEIGYEPDPNQPGLGVRTTAIGFGTVNYGSSSNILLNVTNTGAAPLIATLSSSSPVFTATPGNINLDPGDVQPVSVRFTPVAAGTSNATLSLFHNAGGPVNINLSGTGRAVPIMTLSAANLNFGDVKLNRHGALGLRVDNVGITNLVITNRVLGGPFTVTPTNVIVAPGSNVILNLTFSATGIANFNNTLRITSNDPNNGTRDVPLAGAGFVIRWVDQRDSIEKFTAIAMSGGLRGIAVGDPSTVLFTDNGGHSWNLPDTKMAGFFRGAAMASDGITGWVAGRSNVFRSTDGGRNWSRLTDTDLNRANHFWSCAAEVGGTGRLVVGGNVSGFVTNQIMDNELISATSGFMVAVQRSSSLTSFTTNVLGDNFLGFRNISALASAAVGSQLIILAGASDSSLFRSSNGGTNWSSVSFFGANSGSHRVTGLAINSSGVALLTTDSGEVYRSSNSGSTWTRVFVAGIKLNGVAIDGANARAVGMKGSVFQSLDSGATWTLDTTVESTANLYAISARGNNTWFAGDAGEIQFRPNAPPTGAFLVYQPGSLDYGFVPFQDSAPKALTLLNRGISNLVVNSVTLQSSASQFVVTGLPATIPPEGAHQINVFFNPSSATAINTAATISSSDPAGALSIPVRAQSSISGWVMKAPLPGGGTVVDMHLPSTTVGYAATSDDVFKTTNAGVTWQALNVPTTSAIRTLHFVDASIGYIGGGNLPTVDQNGNITTPGTSFIMRTLNGGTSWSTVSSSSTRMPVMNVNMVNDTTGFAVTSRRASSPTINAVFLRTTSGTSWTTGNTPSSTFNGLALDAVGSTEVFASSGSILFRSGDAGDTWTPVLTNGSTIRDVHFSFSQFGRVVGSDGIIQRTGTGGETPGEWTAASSPTSDDLNRIHFVGIENTGWATPTASASAAAIYRSDNAGANWFEELSQSPYGGPDSLVPTVVFSRTGTNAIALGTGGSVRRFERFTNEFIGVTIAQPVLLFTNAVTGFAQTNTLQVRNLGDSTLTISNLLLDGISRTNEGFRVVNAVPISVPVNSSVNLSIVAENTVAGTNSVILSIVTDGALQSLPVELRAVAAPRPEVVTFRTDPPGMSLRIDGANFTSPVSFTLGDVNGSGQWATGSTHTVEANVSNVVAGQVFSFAGWQPAGERVFSYGATNGSETFTARYLPAGEVTVPVAMVAQSKSKSGGLPPTPRGPFLRLTDASLSNSVFGAFQVNGSLMLSAERIEAALASRAVRLPQSASQPALFQMSAGAWRFFFSTNVVLLQAFVPSLQVLSNTVAPPLTMTINLNLTNAHFTSQFALPDGAVIARDLVEIGPSAASLAFSNFFSLSVTGEVRALRKPDQNDWAFRSSLNLQLRDGPFTNSFILPASVMRLTVPGTSQEFFEARGVSNGRFEVRRNSQGVFSLFLTNMAIDLLNQNIGVFSGLASTAGVLSLNAAPPTSPFEIGPFRWHATENSSFTWNVRNGDLRFTIGGGTLKSASSSAVPGWPSGGLAFPSVSFDSRGDFDHRITLPSFSFGGIGMGQAEDSDDRFVRFRRQNGVLSVKLRDKHEFFDSEMSLGFDISAGGGSTASVSGFFNGRLSADFGGVLGTVNFGRVDLSYDSSASSYQFSGRVRAGGNDFRVRFGSGGGQVCHLVCDDNGCSSTACLSVGAGTGTFGVNPANASVTPRDRLTYAFDWTVPEPLNWHDLKVLQFRIRDEKRIVLWVVFNEADRTFSVYNQARRRFGPAVAAGTNKRLATPYAVLDLARTSVVAAGPTSPTVTLNLGVNFKTAAARKTYIVEAAATDKHGNDDDFKPAGTLTVRTR